METENKPITRADLDELYERLHQEVDQATVAAARAFAVLIHQLDKSKETGETAVALFNRLKAIPALPDADWYLYHVITAELGKQPSSA